MTLTLGRNIASLQAQRSLDKSSGAISRSFERLASGQRINHASDDAAGLAIAESLNASVRIYSQAQRNISDGISVLAIAEGALNALSDILIRQEELAAQSANGVYSNVQRRAMQKESDALIAEYNRIIGSTEFNGMSLFSPNAPEISIQSGFGPSSTIGVDLGEDLERNIDNGVASFSTPTAAGNIYQTATGDFNGDGYADFVTTNSTTNNVSVFLNNGNGTFLASQQYTTGAVPRGVAAGDFNGDGVLDLAVADNTGGTFSVLIGNGNGSFKARAIYTAATPSEVAALDVNNDGILDLVAGNTGVNSIVTVSLGNGNGSFRAAISSPTGSSPSFFGSGDVNGDGIVDLITANYSSDNVSVLIGRGNGTFTQSVTYSLGAGSQPSDVVLVDFNRDGFLDFAAAELGTGEITIRFGQGDGTFSGQITLNTTAGNLGLTSFDINGDGYADIISGQAAGNKTFLGNGDGGFAAPTSGATGFFQLNVADFNNDDVLDNLLTGTTSTAIVVIRNPKQVATLAPLYILTRQDAAASISVIQSLHQNILNELSTIGASQKRLESAFNHMEILTQNYEAARSRIMDLDVAEESANLTRLRILQEFGAAVLGQSNQQQSLVLKLLQG